MHSEEIQLKIYLRWGFPRCGSFRLLNCRKIGLRTETLSIKHKINVFDGWLCAAPALINSILDDTKNWNFVTQSLMIVEWSLTVRVLDLFHWNVSLGNGFYDETLT